MNRNVWLSGPSVVLCLGVLAGCTEEVKRFDVELQVTRADSVVGGALQYSYVDNLGIGDGSGVSQVQGLRVGIDATTIQFTVESVGGAPGLGRSPFLPIPDGETLKVHVLLAPLDTAGLVSAVPKDLGGDACVAADGAGNMFLVGGTNANEAGYAYGTDYALQSFAEPDVLKGVGGLGCGAFQGAVAVVGGCSGGEVRAVQRIQLDGTLTTFPVALEQVCGAMATPANDGGVWVVDGDGTVSLRDAGNTVVFTDELGTPPQAVETTPGGNLVVLAGGEVHQVSARGGFKYLSTATALGRRGEALFMLDDTDIKIVDENKAPDRLRGGVPSLDRFVVLSDDTVVGLRSSAVLVIENDGNAIGLPTSRAHTAIVGLPGDTVLVAGGAGDGFDGFSQR